MSRVVKKSEERKEELLDIALHLFLQKGYENTSVKDIYEGANGSFGMFYHHFDSKEKIFEAAMDRYAHSFAGALAELLLDQEIDFKKRYPMVIKRYLTWLDGRDQVSNYGRGKLDVAVFITVSLKILHELAGPVQCYIEEGCKSGIFHVADPQQAAIYIIYGIYGVIREEGIRSSNVIGAPRLLEKLADLISKVVETDASMFMLHVSVVNQREEGYT